MSPVRPYMFSKLTSTLDRSVRLEDGIHLEPADAASVAALGLLGHLLALLREEAALVHLGLCKKIENRNERKRVSGKAHVHVCFEDINSPTCFPSGTGVFPVQVHPFFISCAL